MAGTNRYEVKVRVRGELTPDWSTVLAGCSLSIEPDGSTLISGELADQAAVHGLLATVRDLGLSLISVESTALPPSASRFGG